MAKDNTLTCTVLLIGIVLFICYMNPKIFEGHTNSPNMALDEMINASDHLDGLNDAAKYSTGQGPATRNCIIQCFNREGIDAGDRNALLTEVDTLNRLSQVNSFAAAATSSSGTSTIEVLNRIRRLETAFRKGIDTNGTPGGDDPPGLCTNVVGGNTLGVGDTGGPTPGQCWTRAKNQFTLLKNIRTQFHTATSQADLDAALVAQPTLIADLAKDVVPKDYNPTSPDSLTAGNFDDVKASYEKYNAGIAQDGSTLLYTSPVERGLPAGWNRTAASGDPGVPAEVLVGEVMPHCSDLAGSTLNAAGTTTATCP